MADDKIIEGKIGGAAVRLDKALTDATELSRERVKALIASGKVQIDGKIATSPSAKAKPRARFIIQIPPPDNPQAQPQDIPIVVVYEDEHLIVVDKPAGMVVHPAAGNPDGTLVNALLHHCKGELAGIGGVARPGIVHRIDKDTSGLLVVAKSDKAHEGLARQFADHTIERRYLALCYDHLMPPAGKIDARLGRSETNRKKMAVLKPDAKRGKHAITHFNTVKRLKGCTLIECRLETGRTHQIRVHLTSIGHGLLGDQVYGRANTQIRPILKELGFTRQALHAANLGFEHPINGNFLRLSSELPSDMRGLIDEIGHSNR